MSDPEAIAYSYHHFFFPFKWDVLKQSFPQTSIKEDRLFDERTNLSDFDFLLNKETWKNKSFDIGDAKNYNQYIYFHSFVRRTIFQIANLNTIEKVKTIKELLLYYEYELSNNEDCFYEIKYLKKTDQKDTSGKYIYNEHEIKLLINGITLHVFNTGVGILSFNLENNMYSKKEEILIINEIGRRIYPQFLGKDGKIEATQEAFLAKQIKLEKLRKEPIIENFSDYNLENNKINPNQTFLPPAHIKELFNNDNFIFHVEENLKSNKVLLSRVMDDRMFFLCWYGNNNLTNDPNARCFKNWHWWYAFIFGDKEPMSIANAAMQEEHLLKHTYARWSEYGTLYGMSRDSFVCLSPDANYMDEKSLPRIDIQMNTMYYQIAVLCLVQRACILKFSAEISNLSDCVKHEISDKLVLKVKNVYANYLEFRNKIYFKEITSQIQGIEIYEQFQNVMNIPAEIEALEKKITALHEFLSLEDANAMNKEMKRLTTIATWFLPASFIATLFGIGFISESTMFFGKPQKNVWIAWIIIIGIGLVASILLLKYNNRKKINRA